MIRKNVCIGQHPKGLLSKNYTTPTLMQLDMMCTIYYINSNHVHIEMLNKQLNPDEHLRKWYLMQHKDKDTRIQLHSYSGIEMRIDRFAQLCLLRGHGISPPRPSGLE